MLHPSKPFGSQNEGLVDLSYLGFIKVTGKQAKELLQGQLTCHMDDISDTKSSLGAHCNPQGRIISLSRVFQYLNDYYLQMPRASIPLAMNALKKYAALYKVALSDASNEWAKIGYAGNLKHVIPGLSEKINEALLFNDLLILNMGKSFNRYEIIGSHAAINLFLKKIAEKDPPQADTVWKKCDIEAKVPQIYPETSEAFLPHSLSLHTMNAISFNKGCYTGQEIIARMQYRGKIKSRFLEAFVNTEIEPSRGAPLYHQNGIAGTIVDFCEIRSHEYAMLILIDQNEEPLFLDSNKTCLLHIKKDK